MNAETHSASEQNVKVISVRQSNLYPLYLYVRLTCSKQTEQYGTAITSARTLKVLFSSKCFRDGFLPIKHYLLGSERRNLET